MPAFSVPYLNGTVAASPILKLWPDLAVPAVPGAGASPPPADGEALVSGSADLEGWAADGEDAGAGSFSSLPLLQPVRARPTTARPMKPTAVAGAYAAHCSRPP